jgi:hypothetical protein
MANRTTIAPGLGFAVQRVSTSDTGCHPRLCRICAVDLVADDCPPGIPEGRCLDRVWRWSRWSRAAWATTVGPNPWPVITRPNPLHSRIASSVGSGRICCPTCVASRLCPLSRSPVAACLNHGPQSRTAAHAISTRREWIATMSAPVVPCVAVAMGGLLDRRQVPDRYIKEERHAADRAEMHPVCRVRKIGPSSLLFQEV